MEIQGGFLSRVVLVEDLVHVDSLVVSSLRLAMTGSLLSCWMTGASVSCAVVVHRLGLPVGRAADSRLAFTSVLHHYKSCRERLLNNVRADFWKFTAFG